MPDPHPMRGGKTYGGRMAKEHQPLWRPVESTCPECGQPEQERVIGHLDDGSAPPYLYDEPRAVSCRRRDCSRGKKYSGPQSRLGGTCPECGAAQAISGQTAAEFYNERMSQRIARHFCQACDFEEYV